MTTTASIKPARWISKEYAEEAGSLLTRGTLNCCFIQKHHDGYGVMIVSLPAHKHTMCEVSAAFVQTIFSMFFLKDA